jgi:2',3'-cyclic-nucleotide 2'-phosphodiesterase (5'-nucleotidase family)
MAALIHQIRKENEGKGVPTLVLNAGDVLQGTQLSSVFHGEVTIKAFNLLPIDASTVGNHEYDYGPDNFHNLIDLSGFPWILSNVRQSDRSDPILPPYRILTLPTGLRVGIVGITTEELLTTTSPKNVTGLAADDPTDALNKYLPGADAQSDLLIVLSHCGISCDKRMADRFGNVDLIVGGHNHNLYEQPVIENNVPIVQAGSYCEYLGRMDMAVRGDVGTVERYRIYPITKDLPSDAQQEAMINSYVDRIKDRGKEVIGQALVTLEGNREAVRRMESNLGDFVCDLVRERLGSDVVMLNGGSFRASIEKGPITVGDILAVFPNANTLYKMNVSGRTLKEAVERALAEDPADNPGAFVQVSGMTFKIDNRQAVEITVGGRLLDESSLYSLVINDFMAEGGDRFTMFKDAQDRFYTGLTLTDLVIEAIKSMATIDAHTDGRIRRLTPWKPLSSRPDALLWDRLDFSSMREDEAVFEKAA